MPNEVLEPLSQEIDAPGHTLPEQAAPPLTITGSSEELQDSQTEKEMKNLVGRISVS
jgi:hypothetical protein